VILENRQWDCDGSLAKSLDCTQLTGTGLRDFRLIIRASCHYKPITAILYTSRTGTIASVIQADSI
jgi:hypothetical protein